jgi:hypothetical protein
VGVQDLQVVDDGFTRSCLGQEEKHMAHEEISFSLNLGSIRLQATHITDDDLKSNAIKENGAGWPSERDKSPSGEVAALR